MYEKLRNYIESLFDDAPLTQQSIEIKEEIIQNTMQKYNELLAEGKSEEAAFNIAVAGIGDVSDLLNVLRAHGNQYYGFTKEEMARENKRSAGLTSVAVMLYILSILPVILIQNEIGVCIMFIMIALATGITIYNQKTRLHYQKKDDTIVENFKQWNTENKDRLSIKNSIISAAWALGLVIYFLVSFATGAWYITWVIFIIMIAVQNVIKAIFDATK